MSTPKDNLSIFNMLIQKYQRKIYWHIRKMVVNHSDADDLTQEVFLKIWQGLDTFRGDAQFFTWMYRIATNECLNFLRTKKRMQFCEIEDYTETFASGIDHDSLVSGDEIQRELQKAILTLPDKQRLVFNMRYFDEMRYEEIARITGTSVGALKATYSIAVHKIENLLSTAHYKLNYAA
ncbi:RNA polymerase sigma factor [Flectobacillus major]|jgi:RNA polymerase sigma-70 factor (ECF subfamily)|uniref:RNA polymerase sigma factor n=1 Tax=Flectobacillus major TaxID=103 RepID=UPI00047DA4A8|nr:sigma-70 family RNA polymerase sigma factor [Flectobacillus major]